MTAIENDDQRNSNIETEIINGCNQAVNQLKFEINENIPIIDTTPTSVSIPPPSHSVHTRSRRQAKQQSADLLF